MNTDKRKEYFAFISYKREDEKWAKWLQHKLEHYHLPSKVRKANESLPKSIRPIFKDTSELSAGVLAEEIHEALEKSKYLIVICSPRAAQSEWVGKEVQTFIDMGRTKQIIPFIIGGTAFAQDPNEECFPSALLNLPNEQELLGVNINEMGRDAAAVKVVARMFDLKFDTLWQRWERDKRNQRNKKFAIIAGIVFLFAIGAFIFAYRESEHRKDVEIKNSKIAEQRDSIQIEKKKTELANITLENKNKELSEKNDSINKQNKLIAQQKNDLNRTNKDLQLSNQYLKEERDNVYRKNQQIVSNLMENIWNEDSYRSRAVAISLLRNNPSDKGIITPEMERLIRVSSIPTNDNGILRGHTGPVFSHSISTDGKKIATASGDYNVKVWDTYNGQCLSTLNVNYPSRFVLFSPDNNYLISGNDIGKLYIWDIHNSERIDSVFHGLGSMVNAIAYEPNQNYIAQSLRGGRINIWSATDWKHIRHIKQLKVDGEIISLKFSHNGEYMLATKNQDVIIFDTSTWETKESFLRGHTDYVSSVAFSKDDKKILTASYDKTVRLWDFEKRICTDTLMGHKDKVMSASFSPDEAYIVSASSDSTLRIWQNFFSDLPRCIDSLKFSSGILSSSFSPNYDRLISTLVDNTVRVNFFDPMEWLRQVSRKSLQIVMSPSDFTSFLYNSDGSGYIWSSNGTAELFDGKNEKYIIQDGKNYIYNAILDPYDKFVAFSSSDNTIKIMDVKSHCIVDTLVGHKERIRSLSYSVDGKYLVSTSEDNTIRIWDMRNPYSISCMDSIRVAFGRGSLSNTFHSSPTYAAFSKNSIIYTTEDAVVGIYNLEKKKTKNGKTLFTLDVSPDKILTNLSINPVKDHLWAISSGDNTIVLWDNEKKDVIKTFRGHTDVCKTVSWSSNGKHIVSASWDGSVKVWDAQSGVCVMTYNDSNVPMNTAYFNPRNETEIKACDKYGDVYTFKFEILEKLIKDMKKRFCNRILTSEEKRKYYLE